MSISQKTACIAGAGLVGSVLALYLLKRGYKVTVIEKRKDPRLNLKEEGRSINLALSHRGIRALNELGLAEEVKRLALPMQGRLVHDLSGKVNFQPYGDPGQSILSISRNGLNRLLIEEAEKLGVEMFFETRCLKADYSATELYTVDQQTGQERTHRPDFLIGADGAFSVLRSSAQEQVKGFQMQLDKLDYGYKELILPALRGDFALDPSGLHIWPREKFMLIALPNLDRSFTCTLFLPLAGPNSFESIQTTTAARHFFQIHFPDALALLPAFDTEFTRHETSYLFTEHCYPWQLGEHSVLIGDAAHAIVPFYGQGMNAGFEDCRVLNELLNTHTDHLALALADFQRIRKPDTDAIGTLALGNFIEMRDAVANADFLWRRKIEARLHAEVPEYLTQYAMVTFTDIPYSIALQRGQAQEIWLKKLQESPEALKAFTDENVWKEIKAQALALLQTY